MKKTTLLFIVFLGLQANQIFGQTVRMEPVSRVATSIVEISSGSELLTFISNVNNGNSYEGKTIQLSADIDLEGGIITSIGGGSEILNSPSIAKFEGTFDGNGKTISNFAIDLPNAHYVGFFGYTENAIIKNLSITSATIDGKNYVGGIVGYASQTTLESCHIEASVGGEDYVGGIVGTIKKGMVKDCINNGIINGSGTCVGGVVGLTF